jgi:diacylglycerol kinase
MAMLVLIVAAVLQVELWRWVSLIFAITIVLAAELLNSAIEQLIGVLHPEHDERIGLALDVSAAGVLVAAIGAVAVGLLTLAPPLWTAALTAMN